VADFLEVCCLAQAVQQVRGSRVFVKLEERTTHSRIACLLLTGLLGAASTATAGDFIVNVGGINASPQSNRTGSDQGHRIDKPQIGVGGISVPDASRRSDNPLGGGPLSDSKSLVGSPAIPSPNTGLGDSSPAGSTTLGQPTTNQFCSNNQVTIGENTQGRLHCSNSVGTFRQ
jgi:hypothetical protein